MGLSNSYYDIIMRKYDDIRLKNSRLLDKRLSLVYQKIPNLKSLVDESVSLMAELAKSSFYLSEKDFINKKNLLNKRLLELENKKKLILEENGLDKEYLSPIYDCKLCKDTGFVAGNKCSCFKSFIAKLVYEPQMMSIKGVYLDNFLLSVYDESDANSPLNNTMYSSKENAEKILGHFRHFSNNFETSYQNFLITGGTGVGKTFVTSCLANEIARKGYSVVFMTAPRLFKLIGDAISKENPNAFLPDFSDVDLFVLDDLGTELINSFTSSCLFDYINERLIKSKPTIISTNLSLADLKECYNERIFSRFMTDFHVLHLTGSDIRISKKFSIL